jgi:hypothetical protein
VDIPEDAAHQLHTAESHVATFQELCEAVLSEGDYAIVSKTAGGLNSLGKLAADVNAMGPQKLHGK